MIYLVIQYFNAQGYILSTEFKKLESELEFLQERNFLRSKIKESLVYRVKITAFKRVFEEAEFFSEPKLPNVAK